MTKNSPSPTPDTTLTDARRAVAELEARFEGCFETNQDLSRSLVSFQANKSEPIFRWFKYREGFSKQLIEYIIDELELPPGGALLDPFAGTGAAVFAGNSANDMRGFAIELMPVGTFFMESRQLFSRLGSEVIASFATAAVGSETDWLNSDPNRQFGHLRITSGAFSAETEMALARYRSWAAQQEPDYSRFLEFVAFSLLEEVSYTRKDGQYLRWDGRSPRYVDSPRTSSFRKGPIPSFVEALHRKLRDIREDCEAAPFDPVESSGIEIRQGSTFDIVDQLPNESIDAVITSPPYCNRYDYTRTYALELAFLDIDEVAIRSLRQALLTCTVENKPKAHGDVKESVKRAAAEALEATPILEDVLGYLRSESNRGLLNNNGIVSMVEGYFSDTAIHLAQVYDKLVPGAHYIMVNDNVRYNGLDVPVDCILSSIAEGIGFAVEKIWVLPTGKGNSSQQMKKHGRSELRKCVYVWLKPDTR